ncbi:MAG: hydroxyethylthiazole kinase [Lachnospiraceae bacterium]
MIEPYLNQIRDEKPRIHCIVNSVSANLCANGLLACGASPIMAEAIEEVEEITAQCQGLCLNLGIPSEAKVVAMIAAGKMANEKGIPVLFDPVGVGASQFRMKLAKDIFSSVQVSMIRGNFSEIKALVTGDLSKSGVDVDKKDATSEVEIKERVDMARRCARLTGAIVAISGDVDVVTDGTSSYLVRNGHPMMSKVTGSGCLLSALITAYLSVNKDKMLMAAVASLSMFGICGEEASKAPGSGSYSMYLLDAIYAMHVGELKGEARYEIY